ncbi:MAG: MFS transporter [Myxococcaceae bacterium]|nr:MFS transporter [Myxococcaceae bacterium]
MIRQGVSALREMYALTRGVGNLRVLMLSNLVGTLAAGLLNPVLPLFLNARGLSLQDIGFTYTLGSLLPIFVQPMLGAWSDRYGRTRFIIWTSLATSLLVPVMALIHSAVPLAVAICLKLLLVRSAAPVTLALVADSAPPERRATGFALLDSAANFMFVAALVASSLTMRWLSTEQIFFLAGALFLASSGMLFGLKDVGQPKPAAAPGASRPAWSLALAGLAAPFAYVRRNPSLAGLFIFQFFFTFGLNLYPIYIPLYATRLGAPPELIGPLVAASWLVFAFVQPVGGRLADRLPQRGGLIMAGLGGMTAISLALGSAGWLPAPYGLVVMVLMWALLAVPDGLFRPALTTLQVEVAPAQERGRFMGALGSCVALAQVLAPVSYGFVAQRLSLGAAFLLSSTSFLLALACMSRVPAIITTPAVPLPTTSEPG